MAFKKKRPWGGPGVGGFVFNSAPSPSGACYWHAALVSCQSSVAWVSHGASFLAPGSLARRRLARVIHHHRQSSVAKSYKSPDGGVVQYIESAMSCALSSVRRRWLMVSRASVRRAFRSSMRACFRCSFSASFAAVLSVVCVEVSTDRFTSEYLITHTRRCKMDTCTHVVGARTAQVVRRRVWSKDIRLHSIV